MSKFTLKPTSKEIKAYYARMGEQRQLGLTVEGNVAPAFADLLGSCARQLGYRLNEQHPLKVNGRSLRLDGAVLTQYNLRFGAWEAKDSADDLPTEVKKKFAVGYPKDNILFQSPERAILVQDGREVLDVALDDPNNLVKVLEAFFNYKAPALEEWEAAVAAFKARVPEVAEGLKELIEREYKQNLPYKAAFDSLLTQCRIAINPQLSPEAVQEMLIQHLLTERIFRKVFDNDRFTRQNAIAQELEKVVDALTSKEFNRDGFMRPLDHLYGAIEKTAANIRDYNEKQDFLNTVYEQFFQGFSVKTADTHGIVYTDCQPQPPTTNCRVKTADTHGIVYTPQPIVQFMVKSVEQLLQREFGRSLADEGVHILDPFVGTGNFILRVMEEIRQTKPSALPHKYAHELHCNEVMLLPYYIASMNIEHTYYEAMGEYKPFKGVCFVDTFELAEDKNMPLFVEENTERVQRQRQANITVVLGNPPYNAGQANENDNNKNRKYPKLDKRVHETYVATSKATNRNKLFDPYVKAFRWASDRIRDEGVVAFVSNNSFLDNVAFDGMRQSLLKEFDAVYVLDLGGNVGKNPKLSGTTHNVFGIQIGVCITFLVRKQGGMPRQGALYYARVGEDWRRAQKYNFLDGAVSLDGVTWQPLAPKGNVWLTEGMRDDWATMLPLGTKEAKAGREQAIFEIYSVGIMTSRDKYVYDFDGAVLSQRMLEFVEAYNAEVDRYKRAGKPKDLDHFVRYAIKWDHTLKRQLQSLRYGTFSEAHVRASLYRPFTKQKLYFDRLFIANVYLFPRIFPTPESEGENVVICVAGVGAEKPFFAFITNHIPNVAFVGGGSSTQCFPLYVYEDAPQGEMFEPAQAQASSATRVTGKVRRENISDWALQQYRAHYRDDSIRKADIFYSLYAQLHDPRYRQTYAANLRRELPRAPLLADAAAFWRMAEVGRKLASLHLDYERAPEYPLKHRENPAVPPSLRVEKMRLSRDKTALIVNDFLTLEGIPPAAFAYKLGSRSALEWVIEQYRVTTDKRSSITNDPNRPDDPAYIVRLVKQVIHVSLETLKLVESLTTA